MDHDHHDPSHDLLFQGGWFRETHAHQLVAVVLQNAHPVPPLYPEQRGFPEDRCVVHRPKGAAVQRSRPLPVVPVATSTA